MSSTPTQNITSRPGGMIRTTDSSVERDWHRRLGVGVKQISLIETTNEFKAQHRASPRARNPNRQRPVLLGPKKGEKDRRSRSRIGEASTDSGEVQMDGKAKLSRSRPNDCGNLGIVSPTMTMATLTTHRTSCTLSVQLTRRCNVNL